MTAVDAASGWTTLIPGFVLAGVGVGLVNPPLAAAAIGVVPAARSGMASGINSTSRQVGIATGIAGLGAIFQHNVTQGTTAALAGSGHSREVLAAAHGQLATILQSGEIQRVAGALSGGDHAALIESYRVGFTGAFTDILIVAGILALLGSALAFALVRSRDFVSAGRAPGPEQVAGAEQPQAASAVSS
jgi:hypothetical protein